MTARDPRTPPDPAFPRDPGLQPERTRLAWRRTSLAVAVVTLLAARLAAVRGVPLAIAAAGLLLLPVLAVAQRRVASAARPAGRAPALLALIVTGYAALGVLLTVR